MQLHRRLCNIMQPAAPPSKFFEAKLIRFGQIWLDLGKFEQSADAGAWNKAIMT